MTGAPCGAEIAEKTRPEPGGFGLLGKLLFQAVSGLWDMAPDPLKSTLAAMLSGCRIGALIQVSCGASAGMYTAAGCVRLRPRAMAANHPSKYLRDPFAN